MIWRPIYASVIWVDLSAPGLTLVSLNFPLLIFLLLNVPFLNPSIWYNTYFLHCQFLRKLLALDLKIFDYFISQKNCLFSSDPLGWNLVWERETCFPGTGHRPNPVLYIRLISKIFLSTVILIGWQFDSLKDFFLFDFRVFPTLAIQLPRQFVLSQIFWNSPVV